MAQSRHSLDVILKSLCPNVYYQAPSKGMKYPCIMYNLTGKDAQFADNKRYLPYDQYDIKVIMLKQTLITRRVLLGRV